MAMACASTGAKPADVKQTSGRDHAQFTGVTVLQEQQLLYIALITVFTPTYQIYCRDYIILLWRGDGVFIIVYTLFWLYD